MTTDVLSPAPAPDGFGDIPLDEMGAMDMSVLAGVIGRALPRGTGLEVRAGAFQSAV